MTAGIIASDDEIQVYMKTNMDQPPIPQHWMYCITSTRTERGSGNSGRYAMSSARGGHLTSRSDVHKYAIMREQCAQHDQMMCYLQNCGKEARRDAIFYTQTLTLITFHSDTV